MKILEPISLRTASELADALYANGFGEEDAKRIIQQHTSVFRRGREFPIARNLKLFIEGLAEVRLLADPTIRISQDASSYGYNGCTIDNKFGAPCHIERKLSEYGLVSAFLRHEKRLPFTEALKRVGATCTLATPFDFAWFMDHLELVPVDWPRVTNSYLVFAGFPIEGRHMYDHQHYPALSWDTHRWNQGIVDNSVKFEWLPSSMFVTLKNKVKNNTKQ